MHKRSVVGVEFLCGVWVLCVLLGRTTARSGRVRANIESGDEQDNDDENELIEEPNSRSASKSNRWWQRRQTESWKCREWATTARIANRATRRIRAIHQFFVERRWYQRLETEGVGSIIAPPMIRSTRRRSHRLRLWMSLRPKQMVSQLHETTTISVVGDITVCFRPRPSLGITCIHTLNPDIEIDARMCIPPKQENRTFQTSVWKYPLKLQRAIEMADELILDTEMNKLSVQGRK